MHSHTISFQELQLCKDHPKNYLKIQALLAKEKKPEGQHKNSLHVAQDLEGYSRKPTNADELAQINANGNEE
jgi:hypothetical protein